MLSRFDRLFALSLVLALVFAVRPVRAAEPVTIYGILSLTGQGAFVGKEETTSLEVIERNVNKAGGIAGRPLKIVVQDDQSSPQVAVQLANNLLAQKATILLGSLVGDCAAMSAVVKDRAILYCLSPAFHPEKDSYGFSAGISTSDAFVVIAHYLKTRGITRVGMISSGDVSGQDADRGADAAFARPENAGIAIVAHEHFNVGDISVAAQLARIRAAGAQALISFNTGTPLGTILHGVNDAGLSIPVVTSPANLNATTLKQFAAYLPKEFLIPGVPSDAPDALAGGPVRRAVDGYVAAFKAAGIAPDHTLASVWDPLWIVVGALKKLGPDATAAQIKDYVESLHGWAGANGEYDFRDGNQRGLTTRSSIMVRWDSAAGRFVGASKLGGSV